MAARWILLALGAVTFLVAAKAHGRQLRLERELAGYWEFTFGGPNPPFIDALWHRERLLYWSTPGLVGLCTLGFRLLAPRFSWQLPAEGGPAGHSVIGVLFLHVVAPLTVAFIATGLLSLARFALALRANGAGDNPQSWL